MGYLKDAIKSNSFTPNKQAKEKVDYWEACPRCESKNVHKMGFLFVLLVGIGMFGISIWLLIIPPVGILGMIIGLVLMVVSPFTAKQLQCKDCKKTWKPKKLA
ncbi:hypothetical protein QGM71_01240 [Virgibacillus sp. C22-A2]|uniref:Uncharacterized protein n=1 Tax=Virgibacillus tibetensis TaxID=3042313 RepID=A0ABU6KAE1_9BACI|nr:hypothetical protein [Virgibacillus sp. C22-A2]